MLDLSAVVIAGGLEPDENTLQKAVEEQVPLYSSDCRCSNWPAGCMLSLVNPERLKAADEMTHRYEADLHIHTLLSPCGEVEMIPSLIVAAAEMAGLDMIGIADHNSCENAAAVVEASRNSGVKVLPGMEAQSVEGVHLLCLFDRVEDALDLRKTVYAGLPAVRLRENFLKSQMVVDADDEFVRYCDMPIGYPTSMDIEQIYRRVESLGGIMIPSHIDRQGTGICHILGMLPESPDFEAVEVSANLSPDQARSIYPSVGERPSCAIRTRTG